MNEWVEWKGGARPVDGNMEVGVRFESGVVYARIQAKELSWAWVGNGSDIVAYRLSKPQSLEEAYDETTRGIVDRGNDKIRVFDTGASRGSDKGKLDYEGFLSPLVLERFAMYMDSHRTQADGSAIESDNWQLGMPKDSYIKSHWRHFMDWWKEHRGIKTKEGLENALCAVIFNAQGYLHELLKNKENN